MQASLEPDKSLLMSSRSLLVYSTSQMALHILTTHLTGPALDGETVYQAAESKHVLYWTS